MAIVGFELWRCKKRQSRAKHASKGDVGACSLRNILHFRPSEIVFGAIWEVITIVITTGVGIASRAPIDAVKGRGMSAHFSQAIIFWLHKSTIRQIAIGNTTNRIYLWLLFQL